MKLTQVLVPGRREFQKIQEFAAACRRQWPDAKIVLRPNEDDASSGADARPHAPETAPGVIVMSAFDNDLLTPTEADLDACYGSKFARYSPKAAPARQRCVTRNSCRLRPENP